MGTIDIQEIQELDGVEDLTTGTADAADDAGNGLESVAVELRSVYSLRQQVEDELHGAVTIRLEAINQADVIVSQAQALAKKMAAETREVVEKVLEAANAEAGAIISRGREEAARATADLANVIAAGEAARADAANKLDHARAEAEVITGRARREANEIRMKAVQLAADNNRLLLDEVERGALDLRRAMESTFSALDHVLENVSENRTSTPEDAAVVEPPTTATGAPLMLKGESVTKAFAKPARRTSAEPVEQPRAETSGRGWRKR